MHLLEKEPDHRYQTRRRPGPRPGAAAGRRRAGGSCAAGRRARPVRRGCCRRRGWWAATTRWRRCEAAFDDALAGRCRGVLVGGAPGVGKTALVDQLRPVVTGQRRLVRGRQVRPVPAGSGVRRGHSGVSRAGSAAAGRAGGRAGRGPRADPGGGRAERGSADRGGAGVRGAAGGAAGSGGSADRAGAGAAQRRWRCCARSRRGNGRWWCSSTTCSGPGAPRSASSTWCSSEEPIEGLLLVGRLPRRRRGRGASAGGAAVPLAGPGRSAAPAAGQPARAELWPPWWPRCCTSDRPRRRAWPS